MPNQTAIEWTDRTSNPLRYRDETGRDVWACVKVSPACDRCYAESQAIRFKKGGEYSKSNMDRLTPYVREAELRDILSTKKLPDGEKVFVGSMTDLFGPWASHRLLDSIFAAIALRPGVVFQILTKRAGRMRLYFSDPALGNRLFALITRWLDDGAGGILGREWDRCHDLAGVSTDGPGRLPWTAWRMPLPNLWHGVTAEDGRHWRRRVPSLQATPSALRFVSAEPLLGEIETPDLDGIGWVVAGGETGAGARPTKPDHLRRLRDACAARGVPFFFKQWGDVRISEESMNFEQGERWALSFGRGIVEQHSTGHTTVICGRDRAGAELDGRTYREWPVVQPGES